MSESDSKQRKQQVASLEERRKKHNIRTIQVMKPDSQRIHELETEVDRLIGLVLLQEETITILENRLHKVVRLVQKITEKIIASSCP